MWRFMSPFSSMLKHRDITKSDSNWWIQYNGGELSGMTFKKKRFQTLVDLIKHKSIFMYLQSLSLPLQIFYSNSNQMVRKPWFACKWVQASSFNVVEVIMSHIVNIFCFSNMESVLKILTTGLWKLKGCKGKERSFLTGCWIVGIQFGKH